MRSLARRVSDGQLSVCGFHLVLLLLQDQDYVPWLDAGRLVSLPGEGDLLPVLHSFVHVHL